MQAAGRAAGPADCTADHGCPRCATTRARPHACAARFSNCGGLRRSAARTSQLALAAEPGRSHAHGGGLRAPSARSTPGFPNVRRGFGW
jgi:hypothetical protein